MSALRALGRHVLLELHGCNPETLKKVDIMRDIMVGAARACGATIVDVVFHEFNPFGVSGVVVIAESHLSIHTWPEHRYAAVDIFTCGDTLKPEEAIDYIVSKFRCRHPPTVVEVKRGLVPNGMPKRNLSPAKAKQRVGFGEGVPIEPTSPSLNTTPSR